MDLNKLVDTGRAEHNVVTGRLRYPAKRKAPVTYTARKTTGRGHVVGAYEGETGTWVVVADVSTGKQLSLRPSQLSA